MSHQQIMSEESQDRRYNTISHQRIKSEEKRTIAEHTQPTDVRRAKTTSHQLSSASKAILINRRSMTISKKRTEMKPIVNCPISKYFPMVTTKTKDGHRDDNRGKVDINLDDRN